MGGIMGSTGLPSPITRRPRRPTTPRPAAPIVAPRASRTAGRRRVAMRSRVTAFGAPMISVGPSRPISAAGRSQLSSSVRPTSPRRASSPRRGGPDLPVRQPDLVDRERRFVLFSLWRSSFLVFPSVGIPLLGCQADTGGVTCLTAGGVSLTGGGCQPDGGCSLAALLAQRSRQAGVLAGRARGTSEESSDAARPARPAGEWHARTRFPARTSSVRRFGGGHLSGSGSISGGGSGGVNSV